MLALEEIKMTIDEKINYTEQEYQRMKEELGETVYSLVEALVVWPIEAAVDCLDYVCHKNDRSYRTK